ncbi:hypothetical protein ACMGE5_00380 [Macrococcus equi]|uniref:hypothetical protein n=1 Tax=Macrococcus equi TaxID=3395462 RepID=UPI0039BEA39A
MKRLREIISFQGKLTRMQFLKRCPLYILYLMLSLVVAIVGSYYIYSYLMPEDGESISFLLILFAGLAIIFGCIIFVILLISLILGILSLVIRRTRDTKFHWLISLILYIFIIIISAILFLNNYPHIYFNQYNMTAYFLKDGDMLLTLALIFILLQPSKDE